MQRRDLLFVLPLQCRAYDIDIGRQTALIFGTRSDWRWRFLRRRSRAREAIISKAIRFLSSFSPQRRESIHHEDGHDITRSFSAVDESQLYF